MNQKKINITLLNSISSLLYQACLVVSNFIIPRIILANFGSDVNGLVSSIAQFLSYISLIEGGITGVVQASLYKPLHDKDEKKISSIIKTATNFYRKIGLIFIAYTLILAVIYPLITNSGFSFVYVATLTVILSFSLLIQYMMAISIRTLLNADKKVYVVSFTQIIIALLSVVFAYVSVKIYPSIHLLKVLTGALFLLQPIIFGRYIGKHYHLDKTAKEDKQLLKNRWDGFAVNLAAFIHNCTDIAILTIFTDLQTVSIYSVYALVTTGLRGVIQSIARGITPTIGHSLVGENRKKLEKDMDLFEFTIFSLVFILFGVATLLITPFVMIYTNGVTDANYSQSLFGILILISEACYLIREHHVALAYSANKFKEITIPCFIEAGLNVILSLILVNWLSLIGVAIGTIIAMSYRSLYQVYFSKKLIGRPVLLFFKNFFLFAIATGIGIALSIILIPAVEFNFFSWLWHGAAYLAIIGLCNLVMMLIFYRDELKRLKPVIKLK